MMIAPKALIELEYKGKPYKELLKIRDEYLEEIFAFEKGNIDPKAQEILPSPEVIYQMNLKYLAELCNLISETYNSKVVYGGSENEDDE